MVNPAREAHGPNEVCTRLPRLLSVATAGAVSLGAAFGLAQAASADPQPDQRVSMVVDIVGDSYMAGDGVRDTYIDPADPRHRSIAAPALQALSRLESDDSRLRVDANIAAASGASTADFFAAQKGADNTVVNSPQRDQIRPDAQFVILGFGGADARLATVISDVRRTANGPNVALDKETKDLEPLLDHTASDEEYLAQARSSAPGQAPTLVARLLQVLAETQTRAPHATIMLTNYPLAADPDNAHAASLVGAGDLTTARKFGYDLNKAIERAVQIFRNAYLVDFSTVLAGHEAYTADSAFNEPTDQQPATDRFEPNKKGASLLANPIAERIASLLRITSPKPSDGRMTVPGNITVHNGMSSTPPRPVDAPKPKPEAKSAPVPHKAPAAKPSNRGDHPQSNVTKAAPKPAPAKTSTAPAKPIANQPSTTPATPAPDKPSAAPATPAPKQAPAGNRVVPSLRDVLAHGTKKPQSGDTTPAELKQSAAPSKREDAAKPQPSDKRVAGTKTSERKPHVERTKPAPVKATPRLRGHFFTDRHSAKG